ncbi:hypothetical protein [Bifidobacterium jacchi]|uniref:hypothetical protein n=1 Tax=Bifidobacterium jacchi TaxID=2490545 RepID=UPI001588146D|nr:hypothetical protein [Bifidobacterium jacchi]
MGGEKALCRNGFDGVLHLAQCGHVSLGFGLSNFLGFGTVAWLLTILMRRARLGFVIGE